MDDDQVRSGVDDLEVEDFDTPTTPVEGSGANDAMTIVSVDNAIKRHIAQLARIREESKVQKEMLESALQSDPEYTEKAELAKAANKEKSAAKARVMKQPAAASVVDKIKDLRSEAKELQEGLSYYLREYLRLTGASQFEDEDGEVRDIVYTAKLVKRSAGK